MFRISALLAGWSAVLAASASAHTIVDDVSYTKVLDAKYGSSLYQIVGKDAIYTRPPYLADLHGESRYEMGYDAGYMLGGYARDNLDALMTSLIGNHTWTPLAIDAVGLLMDWQWNGWLSKQVPEVYLQELQGWDDGAKDAGHDVGAGAMKEAFVLGNLPGSIGDMKYVLAKEFGFNVTRADVVSGVHDSELSLAIRASSWGEEVKALGMDAWEVLHNITAPQGCSMTGAWGSRTIGQKLFTARNLDWSANSGLNAYKLLTVLHPPNATAHALVTYAGLALGALTGISEEGITVHEANLEEVQETFSGFPWLLRLRWIMENAVTLDDAQNMWESSNNTVGFNHGIGSASTGEFMVLETEDGYTAYFHDDDPREAAAMVDGQHVGYPIKDAVWRTNHGYDPKIMKDFLWGQGVTSGTEVRYMSIHDSIVDYENAGTLIGGPEMVNITSTVGEISGTCIISAAYDPADSTAWVAWESNGVNTDQPWTSASGGSYLTIDLKKWW